MSEAGHPPGLWPVPGDGVLARHGGLILLSSLESGQFADVLLDLLEDIAGSGEDGRRFADAVADALDIDAIGGSAAADELPGPSVLAFGPAGSGLAITISGEAWADVVTAHGVQRIACGQPGMLLRCVLRSPVSGVRGGLGQSGDGEARTDRFSRLDGGTVRAGGLVYYPGAAAYQRRAAGTSDAEAPATPAERAHPDQVPPVGGLPAGHVPAYLPPDQPLPAAQLPAEQGLPAEQLPARQPPDAEPVAAAEPWPPVAGAPMPTAAARIPELPAPANDPGTALADEPLSPPLLPHLDAAALAERDLTIAPVAGQPFEAVLLNVPGGAEFDVVARPPLSKAKDLPPGTSSYSEGLIIQGVYCKNGHFDDPEALFCAVCGISMNQQTLVPRPGPRPPLGVLVLDEGSVFQLDKDYIIGREPSLDASVAAGRSRPLRIADDSGIVSRVHAKVQLDGWRVLVTDLGSANGTRVTLPRQPSDQALLPQVPVVLAAGSQVDLGGRVFRYESHRGR